MRTKHKLHYVTMWVDGLARQESVDAAVRLAALDAAAAHITAARKGIEERLAAKVADVAPPPPDQASAVN